VVIYDNLSAGHREAALGAPLIEGDTATRSRAPCPPRHGATAVMHFAAWLSVGESVTDPGRLLPQQRGRHAGTLEAMAAEGCRHFVFSSTCAVYGEPGETPLRETHPTRPINAYGQTKLAVEQALPHFERAYGIRAICVCATSTRRAPIRRASSARITRPEIHVIPRAFEAASGGEPLQVFGEDYPTPGRHLPARLHPRRRSRRGAPAGARPPRTGRGVGHLQRRHRAPSSVREVIAAVERVTGRAVARRSAARRPGDPAVLYASASRIRDDLGWTPQPARPRHDRRRRLAVAPVAPARLPWIAPRLRPVSRRMAG
jgi:UDP-glucose 4-epimerase